MAKLTGRLLVGFAKTLKSPGWPKLELAIPEDLPGFGEIREQAPRHSGDFCRAEDIFGAAGIPRLTRMDVRLLAAFAETLKSHWGGNFEFPIPWIFRVLAKPGSSLPVSLAISPTPTILPAWQKFPEWPD